ncbi:MAG: hypothetical protein JW927_15305 [Deltaproteobacteria bacterium]|nr:hypothetical protein [Deltaproteobacteria bacterium]
MKIFPIFLSGFLLCSTGCAVQQYKVIDQKLHIYLKDNDAEKVYLHSSLDEYAPRAVQKEESGLWVAVLPADAEFKYFYVIDGEVFIPECSMKEKDDFGSVNCVYIPLLGMQ